MAESTDFNWRETESVVIPQVDAVAVYFNPAGDVVIRQASPMGEDDQFVVISPSHVNAVVKALKALIK